LTFLILKFVSSTDWLGCGYHGCIPCSSNYSLKHA